MQESEQGSLSKNTPITIPAYTETEDQDFDRRQLPSCCHLGIGHQFAERKSPQ
jgi:hypothetical protein